MLHLLRHLLWVIRLILLGIIELDRRIFPLFSPLVRVWSEWTGKSNFILARLVALVACFVSVGGVARFVSLAIIGSYQKDGATIIILFGVFLWIGILWWRSIPTIERLVEEAGEEALPRELYIEETAYSLLRPLGLLLYILAIQAFMDEDILLNVFTFVAMFLCLVSTYVLFHYNHGGRSKLKEIAKQIARQLSFSPIPSPASVPSR